MNRKTMGILIVVLAALLVWAVGSSGGGSLAQGEGGVGPQAVLTPLLQYQGRLTNPTTGEPVADGSYTMTFRLYDAASGGSTLWTETEDVSVQGGLFSTVLGDGITPLDQALFNGQALWLGIKVGADAEATPRQQVLPVAYALSLVPGAVVEANSSSSILQVNNTGSGTALGVQGPTVLDGDLNVSGSLTGGSHNHSGAHITSGTVVDARIASTIARDSEIMPTILANDGAGSTLDADLLDGYQGSALFALGESETVSGRPAFNGGTSGSTPPFTVDSNYGVTNLNADLLDGQHASAFAGAAHAHDDRYYTEGESNGRFVNTTGPDAMSGSSSDPILEVIQSGTGVGVYGESTQSHGVRGDGGNGAGDYGGYFTGWGGVAGFGGSGYGGYFNSSSGTALYAAGDAEVTGDLTVDRVAYSSPRTHYFVLGGEDFSSNANYSNSGGCGGAYRTTTSGGLVAPVHLPHGAVVTNFEVFFYDTSAGDMEVRLWGQYLSSCGFFTMAQVDSSGTSGYYRLTDTTISSSTINNTAYAYHVQAYSTAWDSNNLMIKGAVITYTINEAP